MRIEIPAIVEVLQEDAGTIARLLAALKERSALEQKYGNQGGLTVISPTPYRWKPLDQNGSQLQVKIRTLYQKSCNQVGVGSEFGIEDEVARALPVCLLPELDEPQDLVRLLAFSQIGIRVAEDLTFRFLGEEGEDGLA